jgi:hypothetical protein
MSQGLSAFKLLRLDLFAPEVARKGLGPVSEARSEDECLS